MKHGMNKKSGFTLVELAIVLVIIGLIVGGVLVGQDLIKAAENNAAVQQFEKLDAAANTFRTKYNGLPGDLRSPANFGLMASGASGADGLADGDGTIEDGTCSNGNGFGGESLAFWQHLNTAGYVSASGTPQVDDYTAVAALTSITDPDMPQSKYGKGNRVHITSVAGLNSYVVSNFTATTITTCVLTAAHAITPLQALAIDTKKDDANPTTGGVVSLDSAAPLVVGTPNGGSATPDTAGTDNCYDDDTTDVYATSTTALGSALACTLRIRASF